MLLFTTALYSSPKDTLRLHVGAKDGDGTYPRFGDAYRRIKETDSDQPSRATSGFMFDKASMHYPFMRREVLKTGDDFKVYEDAFDQGWLEDFGEERLNRPEFLELKQELQARLDIVRKKHPEEDVLGSDAENAKLDVYLVCGLDRVAEYIPKKAILIDIRSPLVLIELALIDEVTHYNRRFRSPA
ncbi:hypothetical protein ACFL28_05495, partial [Candidatus Omnitrophota bacterium]